MRLKVCIVFSIVLAAGSASAAQIWSSESACMQRQLDLKKVEDLLTITGVEMARASLEEAPKAELGGKIGENRKKVAADIKEMRNLLRALCDSIFQ
ncbi:UNVERIFIED_ORG: hypothetical protein J2W19_003128 [Shinella zoogloeoides]|nr:hypothetical protein [Shinella zoogloeoides]